MYVSRRTALISIASIAIAGRRARAEEEAAATIRQFYDTLLAVMKQAKSMSFDQRFAQLAPAVQRAFDLGLMTRLAVGAAWSQLTPDQQQRLTASFSRFTVSQYAGRFDGYSGERFEVDPTAQPNPNGVIVQTRLIQSSGEPVVLNYLMHRSGPGWQVVDVYLKGAISELATRRSEFAAVLQSAGADGLVRMLDQRSAALRAG